MGISMISNLLVVPISVPLLVSIPNGDKHDFKQLNSLESNTLQ